MKKLILLTLAAMVVGSLSGCRMCRSMGSWFNKGDDCYEAAPPACPPGVPRATVMMPSSPQILPGPIEIAPAN